MDVRGRSFGFAVFEGPKRLIDWGARSFRQGVNAVKVPASEKFGALLDASCPDAIVLRERNRDRNAKRRVLRRTILEEATQRGIPTRLLARRAVQDAFVGMNHNKYRIAAALAERLPELAPRLPIAHKIWMSEAYSLSVFDAVAIGIAYFNRENSACPPLTQV